MARDKGIPASELNDDDLLRELKHLHETRGETFFDGSRSALMRHTERMKELEGEYATRHPNEIEPEPARTRAGARARSGDSLDGGGTKRPKMRKDTREPLRPSTDKGFERRQGERRTTRSGKRGTSASVDSRARGGRRDQMTFRSGKREEGRTTGRGRGVPGLPGSLGRKGGVSTRGGSKQTGAANRTAGRPARATGSARRKTGGGGRRPHSGMQG